MSRDDWPREKKWSNLGPRSEKLQRAKQLGWDYPRGRRVEREDGEPLNVLFVCSKNRWRSPTAEELFRKRPELSVRSRGTSRDAERTLGSQDLRWADIVLVMENKHKQRLLSDFPGEMKFKELHVLDIPDDYKRGDPELTELLQQQVNPILEAYSS